MDRQLNIWTIASILAGPIVTLSTAFAESFDFTFCLFPLTIKSLIFPGNPTDYKELRFVGLIIPLLCIKILLIGAISLVRVVMDRQHDRFKLLYRFYLLVFVISVIKLIGFSIVSAYDFSVFSLMGFMAMLFWTIWLGVAIKRQRDAEQLRHTEQTAD